MMSLSQMKIGDKAEIIGYEATGAGYRAKLLALGLTRGTTLQLIGIAPMGDPLRFKVRGFELSLRKTEASILQLKGL
ncbi:MAG: FeoA family protein [Kiritimatiellia bacterium]